MRGKRSNIWMYFTPVIGKSNKAKCDTCGNEYSYSGGSMSNLSLHIRTKHPSITLPQRKRQRTTGTTPDVSQEDVTTVEGGLNNAVAGNDNASRITSAVVPATVAVTPGTSCERPAQGDGKKQTSLTPYVHRPASVARQKRLNTLLLKMIVRDFQPFSIVEDEGFKEFVHALDPSYVLPTRHLLSKELLVSKYQQAIDSVRRVMSNAEAVSLTTDSWTSICTENYIAVTAHYITADFHFGSCLLECIRYTDRHTADNLCTELRRVIGYWELETKLVAIVTDNAANISAAVGQLQQSDSAFQGVEHVRCFAHTLNLVVQQAVQTINDLKTKVKKVVAYFHQSTVAAAKLEELQEQMRPNQQPLKLKNDVVTRWNSTLHMCERICEVQEPLNATIAVLMNPVECLTTEEWQALREITVILKPFDAVTMEVSAEMSVTASKIIMLSRGLVTACHKIEPILTNDVSKALTTKLLEGMQKRFGGLESNKLLARATFLDPRFKKKGFVTESGYNSVKENITAAISNQLATSSSEASSSEAREDGETESHRTEIPQSSVSDVEDLIWGEFDRTVAVEVLNPQASAMSLVRQFVEEPNIGRRDDPLAWWRARVQVYRELVPLARKSLCIVATSVPSERIFSKTGQLISAKRNRLAAKTIKMVMFLHVNYKDIQ